MCLNEKETNPHLFIHCQIVLQLWSRIIQLFEISWITPPSILALTSCSFESNWPKSGRILWKAALDATVWTIWLERTSRIFRGIKIELPALFHKVTSMVIFWASNHNLFAGISAASFLCNWVNLI
ncbi:hypothetical protein AMTRI_Chr11g153710 [Amborella trichopoda]